MLKLNIPSKSTKAVITKPSVPRNTSQGKEEMFKHLKVLGFKHLEKDGNYILKLEKSDAVFIILHDTYYKVCLWCYEDAYEYKRESYGYLDTSLNVEQLIFKFITK